MNCWTWLKHLKFHTSLIPFSKWSIWISGALQLITDLHLWDCQLGYDSCWWTMWTSSQIWFPAPSLPSQSQDLHTCNFPHWSTIDWGLGVYRFYYTLNLLPMLVATCHIQQPQKFHVPTFRAVMLPNGIGHLFRPWEAHRVDSFLLDQCVQSMLPKTVDMRTLQQRKGLGIQLMESSSNSQSLCRFRSEDRSGNEVKWG